MESHPTQLDTQDVDRQVPERRSSTRPSEPRCPICRSTPTAVTLRTEFAIYYRCSDCGNLWAIEKPAAQPQRQHF